MRGTKQEKCRSGAETDYSITRGTTLTKRLQTTGWHFQVNWIRSGFISLTLRDRSLRHLHREERQYRNWFSSSWSSSCFTSTWLSQRQGWTHNPALRTRGRSPSELRPQYGAQTGRQHPLESCENTLGPRGAPATRAAQARGGGPFAASPRNPDTPRPGLGFLSHSPPLSLSLYLFSLFSGGPGVTAHRTAQRFRQT